MKGLLLILLTLFQYPYEQCAGGYLTRLLGIHVDSKLFFDQLSESVYAFLRWTG